MTTFIIVFAALTIAIVLAEVLREVLHDGPTRQAPPRSHLEDPTFRSPGAWS